MKLLIASYIAIIIIFNMPDKNDQAVLQSTDQSKKPLFSFGIIADVQYADYDPVGTRFYRSSLKKLREAVASFRNDSADFIINLGDLIDKDYRSYKPVLDIIDSSRVKTYHVSGNHDYSVDPRYKRQLPVLQPSQKGYYSFVYNKFRFIFLNGNEISTYISANKAKINRANEYLTRLKNEGETNALDWNGGISSEQLEWLDNQINEASVNNEKILLFCHFPVIPENVHNLLNYKDVLQILEKHQNIIAWFNGHNHEGNYGNFNMIHFITFKGMVETDSTNSFALVEVYKNKIWIRGNGREKSQILAF
jgi:manganese-dependent ADP-ribose/CDP-alcohol diphosphatase